MKIVCIGGGPSGLYLAISMKLHNPDHEIEVYERNQPGDTFGWGVVFSDQTMDNLEANDPVSAKSMADELIHWDYIDVTIRNQTERSGGHGFIGIGRKRMLQILSDRASQLGVKLYYSTEVELTELNQFNDADLIVAADGLNSKIRNSDHIGFDCDIEMRPNKFVWLGTKKRFDDAFTFIFEQTEHGWVWAHCYQFDQELSTFIVECGPETYDAFGFEHMNHEESAETCRKLFEQHLDGEALMTNSSHIRGSAWINFPRVLCHNWVKDNVVLIGDAAHTAHFSIGSGTKLGFEDAISLAQHLNSGASVSESLAAYQDERELEALKLQSAARNSMSWFEDIERYLDYDLKQFTYALLTRSQRVSHENLRLRDKNWLESIEADFSIKAGSASTAVPPMFTPYRIRNLTLKNRIIVSPMSMYSSKNGLVDDWHLVHYGALAKGGAAMVYTEMTNISEQGKITPGCAGIWTEAHTMAWQRIVEFVHQHTDAKMCIQLGHSGPKGATKIPWLASQSDEPLDEHPWEIIGPSETPFSEINQIPRAMTDADMRQIISDFVAATRRAEKAGFDMLELHYAHGYLISAFITPVLNKRTDEYGGCLENRLRFPLEIFHAVREVWPEEKPISIRISSNDWVGDLGITPEESVLIAKAFKSAGVDIVDVSAGQTAVDGKPIYGRMFQTPFSDRIRNEANIPTMAVGNIFEVDHVNSILVSGRADLCCLARPHLLDPNWTLRAAAQQHYRGDAIRIPPQYEAGFDQLERNLQRAAEMAINA